MIRLQTEMAVIGTIYDDLRRKEMAVADGRELHISLNKEKVLQYSRDLERQSGYAIINGFSAQALIKFFDDNQYLFQYDPYASVLDEQSSPIYRLRVENLRLSAPVGQALSLTIARHMVELLDPVINYSLHLLEQMQMLDVLIDEPSMKTAAEG